MARILTCPQIMENHVHSTHFIVFFFSLQQNPLKCPSVEILSCSVYLLTDATNANIKFTIEWKERRKCKVTNSVTSSSCITYIVHLFAFRKSSNEFWNQLVTHTYSEGVPITRSAFVGTWYFNRVVTVLSQTESIVIKYTTGKEEVSSSFHTYLSERIFANGFRFDWLLLHIVYVCNLSIYKNFSSFQLLLQLSLFHFTFPLYHALFTVFAFGFGVFHQRTNQKT